MGDRYDGLSWYEARRQRMEDEKQLGNGATVHADMSKEKAEAQREASSLNVARSRENESEDGRAGGGTSEPPIQRMSSQTSDAQGRLPRGWLAEVAADGSYLYRNKATNKITAQRPFDQCGTNGCILEDRHTGLHLIPELEVSGRRRGSAAPIVSTATDDSGMSVLVGDASEPTADAALPARASKPNGTGRGLGSRGRGRGSARGSGRARGRARGGERSMASAEAGERLFVQECLQAEIREGAWRCAAPHAPGLRMRMRAPRSIARID